MAKHRDVLTMKRVVIIIGTIIALYPLVLRAQMVIDTTNPIQFGVYTHIGTDWQHTGGFSQLGNFAKPYAPFQDGKGDIVMFGGQASMPLSSMMKATQTTASLHVGLRLGFNVIRADLVATEPTTIIHEGVPTKADIRYLIENSFASFGIEPTVEFTPPFHENLRLHAGLRTAWVYSAGFHQVESIISPEGATFIQGGTERMKYESEVPNYSRFEVASIVGASYNIKLSKRFSIAPEIYYQLPITNLVSDGNWDARCLRTGVSIRVTLPTTKPTIRDTMYQRDTLTKALPELTVESVELLSTDRRLVVNENDEVRFEYVHLREHYQRSIPKKKELPWARIEAEVYAVEHDSTLRRLDTLVCKEIIWNDFHPLLNYIFFAEGSDALDVKYKQLRYEDTPSFKIFNDQSQIETYYTMMNIVAMGLTRDPKATITITGCVSQKETKSIPNPEQLSRHRAEVIARYFHQNWGIASSRIRITAGLLPKKPSNEKSSQGSEENQRVEIYSDNQSLLEPVMLRDTMLESNITTLRIRTRVNAESPLTSWKINGEQDRKVLFAQSGEGAPPEYVDVQLDRTLMRRLGRSDTASFDVLFTAQQQGKGEVRTLVRIPMIVHQYEKLRKQNTTAEIDRYILMLFDFGKDNLTPANEKIVHFIKSRIEEGSKVNIVGTTDRSGNPDYNKKLSERRAQSVAKVLNIPSATVQGLGVDTVTYNNDLPEGRFHARTVKIEVERVRHFSSLEP